MEKIYTIPVNEAFETIDGCPFCRIRAMLNENELEIILGAAMMEPDIRIKTNEKGFCAAHYAAMFARKNRLGLALMTESRLEEIKREMKGSFSLLGDKTDRQIKALERLTRSCYLCERIDYHFRRMVETACILWDEGGEFRVKFQNTPHFCLRHYLLLLQTSRQFIDKKKRGDFLSAAGAIENAYLEKLFGDVAWFCKKFDYQNEDEPWGDSKDAVERAIRFLS